MSKISIIGTGSVGATIAYTLTVMGIASDIVMIDINSEKALGECDVEFPYQVPENAYFMLGDRRETSIDSRSSTIGCITKDQILGKILCKFWPLSAFEWVG